MTQWPEISLIRWLDSQIRMTLRFTFRRFAGTSLLAAVCVSVLAAETPNVPPLALASLQHGLTQQQVEEQLKARGDHQFTAALSNGVVRCISYYRNDVYGHYHLLFTNDHLARICRPPPFQMRREPYEGTWASYRVLGDPESRLVAVLRAEDLIGPRLTTALKPQTPPKQSVDPGVTAAFLLAQKSANAGSKSERERTFLALVKQYDPYQVTPGSPLASMEGQLGKPHITESLGGGREIRYYGNIEFGLSASRELMWLAIVYEEGKVVRVFSHDFVDHDKIRPLEEKASRKSAR
jgi:hypothetical protein